MKSIRTTSLFAVMAMIVAVTAAGDSPLPQGNATSHTVSKAEFEQWKTQLSNWGRWGSDDQIGALNLITAAKRRQGFALVKEGFSVSLVQGGRGWEGQPEASLVPACT